MNNSKHPYLFFGIATVVVQAVMWTLFTLFDYGIDERNWSFFRDHAGGSLLHLIIIPIPAAAYGLLYKRLFSGGKPVWESLFQFIWWFAITFCISTPIVHSVMHGTWIVEQTYHGQLIPFWGLEYFLMFFLLLGYSDILLVKLIIEIGKAIKNKKNQLQR